MEPCSLPSLPKRSELSPHQLGFLDEHFRTHEDLLTAASHLAQLSSHISHSEVNLLNLHRNLTQCAVSWIRQSFVAKSTLQNLSLKLEDLSLCTSQCSYNGIRSKKIPKILGEELPKLAKELRQIENIRKYVGQLGHSIDPHVMFGRGLVSSTFVAQYTALKLEALVGDLEDAVFCPMDHHKGARFSAKLSNQSVPSNFGQKQERLHDGIKAMNDIEEIVLDVAEFHPQWDHLLESVDSRVDKTFSVLRAQVLAEHRALLASLGWPPKLLSSKIESGEISDIPNPLVLMEGDKRKSYSQSFLVLCALQHLQTRRETRQLNISEHKETGLWAIDELVFPISSRVEYHFQKWVEQPEFMFTLVYKVTRDFISGVDDVLQPLIDRARLVSYSANEAWVSAMVRMLSGFLVKIVFPSLADRYKEKDLKSEVISSWLHLVDLIIAFDKQMQSLVSSETCLFWVGSERFEGLAGGISVMMIFCGRPEWLKIWAKIELKGAWKKLKAELTDERAWLIDSRCRSDFQFGTEPEQFLLSTREEHKAPLVAEVALKITWKLIERCLTLPAILPRIQFVRSTAARFLWHFFKALLLRCKTTEFSFDNPDDRALIRVCGSINAARYVESKLQEWNDDVNFLEMRIAESNSTIHPEVEGLDKSCFFREEVKSLAELETNWLMEIIAVLLRQFETQSWEYFQNKQGFEEEKDLTSEGDSVAMDLAISIDLVEALDTLRSQLHVLKASLNPKDFLDLWRSVAEGLDHFIFCSIVSSDIHFSSKGVNQFGTDVQALFLVFQPFCARPEAFFPCIREMLKLLKMSKEEIKHLQVVMSNDRHGMKCLRLVGVSHLSFVQVEKVLNYRKFWT